MYTHIASKQKRYLHPKIIKVMNCIFKWICLKYFEIFQHISDWKNSGNHRDFIRFPYSKISSKIFQLSCFDEAVHGCRPTRVCPFCPTAMTTLLQTPEFTLVDGSQHQGNKKIKKNMCISSRFGCVCRCFLSFVQNCFGSVPTIWKWPLKWLCRCSPVRLAWQRGHCFFSAFWLQRDRMTESRPLGEDLIIIPTLFPQRWTKRHLAGLCCSLACKNIQKGSS